MRRNIRWILLALVAMLLVLGICCGLHRTASPAVSAGKGSAALGLVLLDAEEGVYVLAVSDQSPAHLAGLAPGDYILRADGQPVNDVSGLDERLHVDMPPISLAIRRNGQELRLTLPRR